MRHSGSLHAQRNSVDENEELSDFRIRVGESQRGSQRVMSKKIHFYSEPQETEDVSKNDLLTQSLLSREG
jgi:hypothetical protein